MPQPSQGGMFYMVAEVQCQLWCQSFQELLKLLYLPLPCRPCPLDLGRLPLLLLPQLCQPLHLRLRPPGLLVLLQSLVVVSG